MKQITIGIVAHVDAGKTTLTEQMLYASGAVRTVGSVDKGTAVTDFMEVERERGISVKASGAMIERNDIHINIIDTPGHVDFASEVERALSVLDIGILVISAADGIEAQTELLYEALKSTGTNVIFFINKVDRAGSDVTKVIRDIKERFTPDILVMNEVIGETEKECSVRSKDLKDEAFQEEALEAISAVDDITAERYLEGDTFTVPEIRALLKKAIKAGGVSPVLCGSAFYGVGVEELLQVLEDYGEPIRETDQLSGYIFKISHDKSMGRIAHVRMFGGELENRDEVGEEKISQIRKYNGSKFIDVGKAVKGDIAALCGLKNAKVGDIIGEAAHLKGFELSVPLLKVRAIPDKEEDLYPLMTALSELTAEDPKLEMEFIPEEKEIDVHITGAIQIEILEILLKERYGLSVTFSDPTVIYKETPLTTATGRAVYTMPKPCWAIIDLLIEPKERGFGFEFESTCSNVDILYRYQHHVEEELPRALKQGMYNWEVTDLKVTLTGGSHHHVHTHPLDFFLATPWALMDGLRNAGTTLLEPMQLVKISVPEEFAGKIIGDLTLMRGEFDSPVIADGRFTVEARVPASTFLNYSVTVASMTSGRGMISTRFDGYQPCALELGAVAKRRGVNPLDTAKWILYRRQAITE